MSLSRVFIFIYLYTFLSCKKTDEISKLNELCTNAKISIENISSNFLLKIDSDFTIEDNLKILTKERMFSSLNNEIHPYFIIDSVKVPLYRVLLNIGGGHFYKDSECFRLVADSRSKNIDKEIQSNLYNFLIEFEKLDFKNFEQEIETTNHLHGPLIHLYCKKKNYFRDIVDCIRTVTQTYVNSLENICLSRYNCKLCELDEQNLKYLKKRIPFNIIIKLYS